MIELYVVGSGPNLIAEDSIVRVQPIASVPAEQQVHLLNGVGYDKLKVKGSLAEIDEKIREAQTRSRGR